MSCNLRTTFLWQTFSLGKKKSCSAYIAKSYEICKTFRIFILPIEITREWHLPLFQAMGAPCANLYTWSRFVTKFQSFSRSVSPKLKLRLELSLDNFPINWLQWLSITTRWYINGNVSNADDQQHFDDQQTGADPHEDDHVSHQRHSDDQHTGADPHEDDHVSHQQLQRPRCKWAPAPQWTRGAPAWSMRHIALLLKISAAPTIIRKGSGYQIGWIFGKIPNGIWPPPHF